MYDVVIIGSGPAGLSAAVYAKRADLNAVVLEKEYFGTGQIAESSRVDNYLGLYGESGYDLGERFRRHAEAAGAAFREAEVVKIIPRNGSYLLKTADGQDITARTVIYAAGTKRRQLGIKGESEFLSKGISFCAVCDGAFYEGKKVAVIGGGDTALSDALYLSGIAEKVYLLHRRAQFRANAALQNAVKQTANVECMFNAVPNAFLGAEKLRAVNFLRDGAEESLTVDGVFLAIGSVPNSGLLAGIADRDENGYILADENGITSAAGIFAAGDVRTKRLRQVITAAADGANCAESARLYLSEKRS